ncbi:MAG: hypothetical protein LBM75_03245 [Myxococcales bacterium]|jgi:hypothetical protein|nr:hypothetical protein [Myxococcales bacterium]
MSSKEKQKQDSQTNAHAMGDAGGEQFHTGRLLMFGGILVVLIIAAVIFSRTML